VVAEQVLSGPLDDRQVLGPVVSMASPFTGICVLIDPAGYAPKDFDAGAYNGSPLWIGRMILLIATMAASGAYCGIVYGMYRSMVKNFDMIIRRQHQ
jgi:hypothetical protein